MKFVALFILFIATVYQTEAAVGFRCPRVDGRFPVYIPGKDCTKFYECSNGIPYLFTCPATLYFNPESGVCDYQSRVACRPAKDDTDNNES